VTVRGDVKGFRTVVTNCGNKLPWIWLGGNEETMRTAVGGGGGAQSV
jgi:hypothetical protein